MEWMVERVLLHDVQAARRIERVDPGAMRVVPDTAEQPPGGALDDEPPGDVRGAE
jgi:hypothetical protein